MRQWHVYPEYMCRQHLLGEHVEHHMFVGSINKGINIDGYIRGGLIMTNTLHRRHDDLVEEMERRGYNHNSSLPDHHLMNRPLGYVDLEGSLQELLRRCSECNARYLDATSTGPT